MSILTRVKQLIFGSTGASSNFGQIGSQTAGSPVNTKDLATIQALSQYLAGLQAITNSNEPYLEDLNSLYLLITSQIAYIMQNGIPEYEPTTDYFNLISFVQVNGVVYQSIAGTSGTPNNGNAPASSPSFWRNVDPYTVTAGLASEISRATAAEALLAPLASPAFTGNPTAPTQTPGDSSTKLATTAFVAAATGASNPQIQTAVTEAGLTWDPTDNYMLSKAEIALSHFVGENLYMDVPLTQVILSAARSSANPSYPQYCPVIERNVDKVITTSQSLPLVTALRAFATSVLGNSSWAGTVSGVTITFANTTANNTMIQRVIDEALVRQWMVTQDPNFAATGPLFSGGPAAMTVNIAGVDYIITGASLGAHTLTVSGSPPAGSQTIMLYPYRIQGSATSIQLPSLSGFVPVASGDSDGTVIDGYRVMDTMQGHYILPLRNTGSPGFGTKTGSSVQATPGAGDILPDGYDATTGGPTSDGTNGAPRTGKNNSPRTTAKRVYIFAGVLTASA